MRHPAFGIGHLPVLILVGRSLEDLGVVLDHLLPLVRITLLVGQSLGIHAIGEDDGIAAVLDRTKDVGPQDETIVHLDRLMPRDPHAVTNVRAGLDRGILSRQHCVFLRPVPDTRTPSTLPLPDRSFDRSAPPPAYPHPARDASRGCAAMQVSEGARA